MGGGRRSSPSVQYIPAPPPPLTQQVTTQSLQSQIDLTKVGGAQQRLNLETDADLDRANEEFFATQDIRRLGAQGAEQRLGIKETGAQNRLTTAAEGTQRRLTVGAMGEQERKTVSATGQEQRLTQKQLLAGQERQIGMRGTEQRAAIKTTGTEQRATARTTAGEQRTTEKQRELFRRYKENRDYDQSQQAYKS